jgi:hypothetical protein
MIASDGGEGDIGDRWLELWPMGRIVTELAASRPRYEEGSNGVRAPKTDRKTPPRFLCCQLTAGSKRSANVFEHDVEPSRTGARGPETLVISAPIRR